MSLIVASDLVHFSLLLKLDQSNPRFVSLGDI